HTRWPRDWSSDVCSSDLLPFCQEIVLKRNPHYWQKGKPYLDQITFLTVTDTNTRQLQLQGGQEQIDQFPDWQTVNTLKSTPGIKIGRASCRERVEVSGAA